VSDFGSNIAALREQKGLSRSAMADMLGVNPNKIKHIETGYQRADHEFLAKLKAVFSVSVDQLLTGQACGASQNMTNSIAADFIPIPRFDIEASAGHGSLTSGEEAVGAYTFRKSWLDRRNLKQENLAVITVTGDSMEPDLFDGDRIVVDRSQTAIYDGRIYAVHFSDGLFVKRIQRLPGDRVLLISSNSRYSQIHLDHTDLVSDLDGGSFKIVGRVVASMHEW